METQIINAPNSFTDNLVNSGCNHTLLLLSRRIVSTLRSKSMTCEQDATTSMRDSLQLDPGHKLQVDATFAADSPTSRFDMHAILGDLDTVPAPLARLDAGWPVHLI